MNRHKLIPGKPEGSVEKAIVFCAKQKDQNLLKMKVISTLCWTKMNCVYVKGGEYISMMEDYGLVFSE